MAWELISIINFISKKEASKCNSISSISFTGISDIYSIESASKSNLFNDKESIQELISTPEHFNLLSVHVEKGKNSKSFKFNLKNIFQIISDKLFGNIITYIVPTLVMIVGVADSVHILIKYNQEY